MAGSPLNSNTPDTSFQVSGVFFCFFGIAGMRCLQCGLFCSVSPHHDGDLGIVHLRTIGKEIDPSIQQQSIVGLALFTHQLA